ncbi:MAG: hypothetical protein IJI66_14230 [Erysipelotrichaceae bacterium]|nr:hypothetical protein [Erysipelotrichaceae bacterium]
MTDKQRKYAIKLYLRRLKENPDYSENEFGSEVLQHFSEKPLGSPGSVYEPFAMYSDISNLWKALNMSPAEIVKYSGQKMSKFAERFVIPYRTIQAWCDGTNPCPIYTRIMLCELLGILNKTQRKQGER